MKWATAQYYQRYVVMLHPEHGEFRSDSNSVARAMKELEPILNNEKAMRLFVQTWLGWDNNYDDCNSFDCIMILCDAGFGFAQSEAEYKEFIKDLGEDTV